VRIRHASNETGEHPAVSPPQPGEAG
jgi:hypothetical protein